MTRPVTMSPPVQFRLPVELYEVLEKRAAAKNLTVSQHLQAQVIASFAKEKP